MNQIKNILQIGETVTVEFKRCGSGMDDDTYETICSFLNRFGGDIYCGINDDGSVNGIPEKAVTNIIRNFIKVISNPEMFEPTVYLSPERIVYDGKIVLKIHVPQSSEVHKFKKTVFDRVDDSDVKVTSTDQIAQMYIRKQNIFTEKRVYKYVTKEDLRMDLLPLCRQRAVNRLSDHPWKEMDDDNLLRSAGLFSRDYSTGETGFNLAAVMLLGKDDVINDICPAYKTDAILRRINTDRYDDREIISTNLIESFDKLMAFGHKWLPDKFYLEELRNFNLRDIILKEMISNVLIHREYSSSYPAKFIIESDRMYTENACKARFEGSITPENLDPYSKNPIIAKFFHNIGNADVLGSGTRNLFKYTRLYSGEDPEIIENDIFRIIIPLDDSYSYDKDGEKNARKDGKRRKGTERDGKATTTTNLPLRLSSNQALILNVLKENPTFTEDDLVEVVKISKRNIEKNIKFLRENSYLSREGNRQAGKWIVITQEKVVK